METILASLRLFWQAVSQGNLLSSLGVWNYIIMSALVMIEGPAATLLGAAAASRGIMSAAAVFAVAALSNMTSDLVWYSLGRSGKVEWILRAGRVFGLKEQAVHRLQIGMQDHAARIIFLAKLTNGISIASLVAAGLTRVPIRRWFPSLVFAETIWTGSLVLIGYHATIALSQVTHGIEIAIAVMSAIFLSVVFFLARRAVQQEGHI